MASFRIERPDLYPDGTVVKAYPRSSFHIAQTGAPSGTVVAEVIASGGAAELVGLSPGVPYTAYALVAGQDRVLGITPAEDSSSSSDPGTLLLDTYYDGAIFTTHTGAINAAVAAAQAERATLECHSGRVYGLDTGPVSVAPTAPLTVNANGATFRAEWGKPRCVDFTRTVDYCTFEDVVFNDATFDANNLTATTNQAVVGNLVDGAWGRRVNATGIRLRRCRWKNVPVGSTVTYSCFSLASKHEAAGETQTSLTDIRIEDARMRGGNVGAAVFGTGGSTSVEVYHDRIYLDIDHDTGVIPTAAVAAGGANVQIGGRGFGDGCEVHLIGANSSDVGIEIDGMQYSRVTGTVTDARNDAFFARNFHAPPVPAIQWASFRDCRHRVVNLTPDGTYAATGYRLSHTATPNPKFGTMFLDGCTSDSRATTLNVNGSGIEVNGPATRLITRNYGYNQDAVAYTLPADANSSPIYLKPSATDSNGSASPFTWVNLGGRINVAGAVTLSGHAFNYRGVWADLVASADVTLDGGAGPALEFATALTGTADGSVYHVDIGPTAAPSPLPSVRGELRFRVSAYSGGDTKPYGAHVPDAQGAAAPFLELKANLTFPDCDCGALPVGSVNREVYAKTQVEAKSQGQFMVLHPGLQYANGGARQEDAQLGEATATSVTFVNRRGVPLQVWLTGAAASKVTTTEWARRTDVSLKVLPGTNPLMTLAPGDTVKWTFTESAAYKLLGIVAWP